MWDINGWGESFSPSQHCGGLFVEKTISHHTKKREQLSLLSATISIYLIQSRHAQHLRFVSHNHDIIHLLVLLP